VTERLVRRVGSRVRRGQTRDYDLRYLDLTTRVIKKSRPLTVTPGRSASSPACSSSPRVWAESDSLLVLRTLLLSERMTSSLTPP
jgi:hypothetical protein